jgi:hypothetical protein
MRKLLYVTAVVLLLCSLFPISAIAGPINTCEFRGKVKDIVMATNPVIGQPSDFIGVTSSAGTYDVQIDCNHAPAAWDPANGYTDHCDHMSVGDCFHAKGKIGPQGQCDATVMFARIDTSYCL